MARGCVKYRNNLRLGAPVGDIVLDELKVENGSRQIPFEHQGADTEGRLHFCQLHRDIDMKRFFGSRHGEVPFESANGLRWNGAAPFTQPACASPFRRSTTRHGREIYS